MKDGTRGEYPIGKGDTLTLKRRGALQLGKMRVVKDDNQKNPIRKIDEAGNWTERFEGCNEYGEPNFIIRRDIEYVGGGNDWEKIPVRGKVKKVQQRSYVAIAKGPQAVDKGEKKGQFFVYEFGENGWKQLPDAISRCYQFIPASVVIEEHHIGVYSSKLDEHMIKAPHPRKSASWKPCIPVLAAAVINGKYVNAVTSLPS